jgi:hypothetical protein
VFIRPLYLKYRGLLFFSPDVSGGFYEKFRTGTSFDGRGVRFVFGCYDRHRSLQL